MAHFNTFAKTIAVKILTKTTIIMRKLLLITTLTTLMLSLNAQEENLSPTQKVFQKLVLDIGASPYSYALEDNIHIFSYSIGLGYLFSEKSDVRMNIDKFDIHCDGDHWKFDENTYSPFLGLSLSASKKYFVGKDNTLFDNTSLAFVGKTGMAFSQKNSKQKLLFFDLSTRIYFGNVPYLGIGYNLKFYSDLYTEDLSNIYLSFGIDF